MKRVDLHMHTTHSDGSYTPAELIRYCKEKNLACVSVTDHDTMSSFGEVSGEAKKQGIELIPGIEISVEFGPGTLHILGYFLDPEHSELQSRLADLQRARGERNVEIVRRLNAIGISVQLEDVAREAYGSKEIPPGKQIGRPHFAKVLLKKGHVNTLQEAFEKFLSKGKPAYVDKRRITSREAIQMITEAGGVASVAHPKQMRLETPQLEKELERLKGEGLGAIEVYNSCQKPSENEIYLTLAKRLDLAVTGGSDFHGSNKPGVDLGWAGEGVNLGYEIAEVLRERLARRKQC